MSGEDLKKTSSGAANDSNCLSNGEQGREGPKVYKNDEDSLNFGWFSLPRDEQNAEGSRRGSRPASVSGRKQQGDRPDSQSGVGPGQCWRPPSQSGRPQSQSGRPQSQSGRRSQQQGPSWNAVQAQTGEPGGSGTYLPPPSRQGHCHPGDSQRLVVSHDPDMVEFERPHHNQHQVHPVVDQSRGQGDDPTCQGLRPEIEAVDWPLSRTAQEMLMRQARPPAEPGFGFLDKQGMSSRPGSRGGAPNDRQIPPTPMPPLHWNGYRNSNRPTFASWRERWHKEHSHADPNCKAHQNNILSDFNNNHNGYDKDAETNGDTGNGGTNNHAVKTNSNNSNSNITSCRNGDKNNNSDCTFSINRDDVDPSDSHGCYWNKIGGGDHVTNIGTEFIFGYDGIGSIFKSMKDSGRSATVAELVSTERGIDKCFGEVGFLTDANKNVACNKRAPSLACRKHLKKRDAKVGPARQTSGYGLHASLSDVNVKCGEIDFEEERPPAHAKPVNKKTPFTLNFRSRVKDFKQAASCWGKKVRGRSLPRTSYSPFENDS